MLLYGNTLLANAYNYPLSFPDSNKYCDRLAATGTYRNIIRNEPELNGKITYHGQKLIEYNLINKEFWYQVTFSYIKNKRFTVFSYIAEVYYKEKINACVMRSVIPLLPSP